MVWKIRADCTYTTAANKTSAQNAAQAAVDAYNLTPAAGRFPAGLVSHSTTRFTVSYDAEDAADAQALQADLIPAMLTGKARSTTLFSAHQAD